LRFAQNPPLARAPGTGLRNDQGPKKPVSPWAAMNLERGATRLPNRPPGGLRRADAAPQRYAASEPRPIRADNLQQVRHSRRPQVGQLGACLRGQSRVRSYSQSSRPALSESATLAALAKILSKARGFVRQCSLAGQGKQANIHTETAAWQLSRDIASQPATG
jgi:hypothetical protein